MIMAKVKEAAPLGVEREKQDRLEKMLAQERDKKAATEAQRSSLEEQIRTAVRDGSTRQLADLQDQATNVEAVIAQKGRLVTILEEEVAATLARIQEIEAQERRDALPVLSQEIIAEATEIASHVRDVFLDAQAKLLPLEEKYRHLQSEWTALYGPFNKELASSKAFEPVAHCIRTTLASLNTNRM